MTKQELSRPENTKAHLMDASLRLFAKNGYAATSVKEIADAAGVNISLVSYHFGGKEGLYKACLESYVNGKLAFTEQTLQPPTSKDDFKFRLRIFVENMIEDDIKNSDVGCIMRREIEYDEPIIFEVFQKTVMPLFSKLYNFIQLGIDKGYLRQDLHARTATVLFMGGLQHALRTDRLRQKLFNETIKEPKLKLDLINTAMEMFFNGMEAERGNNEKR
jgi:AcrR family transcriptional regulator